MNHDLYLYITQLHRIVEIHQKKIQLLEKTINELSTNMKTLKEKPVIHVDTIEYKFDQLKVEKLDGTLNIGVNPSDLQDMDEFTVGSETISVPPDLKQSSYLTETRDYLFEYCDKKIPELIEQLQHDYNLILDSSYYAFIAEDIKKQLPDRIQYYYQKIPIEQRQLEHEIHWKDHITQKVEYDIAQAIQAFFKNFPKKDDQHESSNHQP